MTLSLGFSPCPNDTFLFYALVHGRVGLDVRAELADVETLNARAGAAELDLTKISYGAIPALLDDYVVLRSGGALGRGCGPLVVAKEARSLESLRGQPIAIPGERTTAFLLLRLRDPRLGPFRVMSFHRILSAVASGEVAAGLIIHESRFTYPKLGLSKVIDLGEWWEGWTGLPIPLGGILARRALGAEVIRAADRAISQSVRWALAHPQETRAYVRAHAQELDEAVIDAHIKLYVTDFSVDVGDEGEAAVRALLTRAAAAEWVPPLRKDPFALP